MKNKKSNEQLADKFARREEKRKYLEFKRNLLLIMKKRQERNDDLSIKL